MAMMRLFHLPKIKMRKARSDTAIHKFDDLFIALVQLPKWKLTIKIKGQLELFLCPAVLCHEGQLTPTA